MILGPGIFLKCVHVILRWTISIAVRENFVRDYRLKVAAELEREKNFQVDTYIDGFYK